MTAHDSSTSIPMGAMLQRLCHDIQAPGSSSYHHTRKLSFSLQEKGFGSFCRGQTLSKDISSLCNMRGQDQKDEQTLKRVKCRLCCSKLPTDIWHYLLYMCKKRDSNHGKSVKDCVSSEFYSDQRSKDSSSRLVDIRSNASCESRVNSQLRALPSAFHEPPIASIATVANMGIIMPRISYKMDVLLERNPLSYILLLVLSCCTLLVVGGILFSRHRSYKQVLEDSFWDSWACVCSPSTHLREKTRSERAIGLTLAIGGLLFYSLLTSTMTAQFKSRMEWLKEGAHSEVMEEEHVVICGTNSHLTTILKQLNKSQELAIQKGLSLSRKQTVLLLSEHERKDTEKMVSNVLKECPRLNILTRRGSLSDTMSFQKVAADKAHSVIVLAQDGDGYEADADSVLTVLALQPLLEGSTGKLVVEVLNPCTAELLKSGTGVKVNSVQNLSSKIFVQCSRQRGLIDVYRELLDHDKQVINLRNFPGLAGISYGEVRKAFSSAVVCGIIRNGQTNFHPKEELKLESTDKLLIICKKDGCKQAPEAIMRLSDYRTYSVTRNTSGLTATPGDIHPSHIGKRQSKASDWQVGPRERILILGWHSSIDEMVTEYDDYVGPGSELIILSEAPIEERQRVLNHKICKGLKNVHVIQQVGNPMSRADIRMAISLTHINQKPRSSFKHASTDCKEMPLSIVVIPDKSLKSGDKSRPDKKSVFALLLAEDICKELKIEVASLVAEFADTELGKQVMDLRPDLSVIGTDEITGLVTAQVAEQCELNNVWTELLNSWGNEIYMKDIKRYLKDGELASFAELTERARLQEEVAIGFRMGNRTVINPPLKSMPLKFSSGDSLVVISEFEA